MTKLSKDKSISILRVLGMIMILCCHISSWLGISALSQFFNVGVQLFLLISGYLYGNKIIKDNKAWIIKQFNKLYIPFLIFNIFILFSYLILGYRIDVLDFMMNLIGIQGYQFIFPHLYHYLNLPGTGHLWFIFVILICYLLTVGIKMIENKYGNLTIKSLFLLFLFSVVLSCFEISINYIFIYFVGYALSKIEININNRLMIISSLVMIISIFIRLIGKYYFDETVLYNYMIVGYTHDMIAFCIFIIVKYLVLKLNKINNIVNNKFFIFLEKYSFYIYIVHYMFLVGPYNISLLSLNIFLELTIFVICILLCSIILKYVTKFFNELLGKLFQSNLL